jgi:hypothetical protein
MLVGKIECIKKQVLSIFKVKIEIYKSKGSEKKWEKLKKLKNF